MQKHKTKIIITAVVIVVLTAAFLWGGNYPAADDLSANESVTQQAAVQTETIQHTPQNSKIVKNESNDTSDVTPQKNDVMSAPKDNTQPVQQNEATDDSSLICTISIRCDTILNNIDRLSSEKVNIVPSDGVILAQKQVTFYDGESVFDVLLRETRNSGVHLEFVNTPMYNSAYIEGIGNLYEFDCGELSGWMYKVNDSFPNYGCSQYQLKDGDKIQWVYTCDLGKDVGGEYSGRNGM